MKKFMLGIFVLCLVSSGVSYGAHEINVQDVNSMQSCKANQSADKNYYLSGSYTTTPRDWYTHSTDSLIGGSGNGSTVKIWKNGVISQCSNWKRISNVAKANTETLIFQNIDGCEFQIPNYIKTSSTGIDAQINYTVGYSEKKNLAIR